uniref:DUF5855 domain-containing protein n=1 Tax=viral metagenome TaxID=1070528 RepID=A0A6C0J171_9ZZZZ
MDVDTFKIRLTALPFLSKADVASYQQRVQQGKLSPETIFREAVRVNKQRKDKEISKKKRQFRFMIADLGLGFWDRRDLYRLIDEKTVLLRLKARADKLVKIRERENIGQRRGRLSKFLAGLKINTANKDKLLERFDEYGESVKVLSQNAVSLLKKKKSEAVSKDREFLKKSISRIGISSTLQAKIMSKFKPGKESVQKLIEEARRLKKVSGKRTISVRRGELSQLAKKLEVAANFSKRITAVDTIEKADTLKETIEKTGEKKRVDTINNEKDVLKKIVKEIGIQGSFSGSIAAIKNKVELNAVKLDIVEASKVALAKLSNEKNVSSDFSRAISSLVFIDRLVPLKKQIENAGLKMNDTKKQKNIEALTKNKQNFIEFVKKSTLPLNRQQVFINRMSLVKVDIPKLREDVIELEKNLKNTQRKKELSELGAYIKFKNINKTGLINKFKTTNVSLINIKKEVDDLLQKKKNLQAEKNNLTKKAKRISLNLNITNNVKGAREKIENAYKKKIQNNKKQLSNFALQANISALGNLTKISNVNTLNMAKEMVKQETKNKLYAIAATLNVSPVLVSKIGSINTIQDVKNVSQGIKSAIHKRTKNMKNATALAHKKNIAYVRQLETKQKKINELVGHMTNVGLPPNDHIYFIEQYTLYNKPINIIKKEVNERFIKIFKAQREQGLPNLIEELQKYELDESNIEHIVNKYTKTYIAPNTLINEAQVIKNMRTQERWVEVEEELIDYLDRLTLKPENRRKITVALNSFWVDFGPLKKSATNMAIKTRNEPRALGRKELENHTIKFGLNRVNKFQILRNYNQGAVNLNTLKAGVENLKGMKNTQKNIENKMKKNQNYAFKTYLTNNLGLNNSNEKVKKLLNNYNRYPNYIQNHMSEAETLKSLANERRRLTNSAKMLPMDEKRNKRIENIKNANDVAQLNSDISNAYVAIIRKEISNMVLQSGVKANINTGQINSLQKGEEVRAKLMNAIERKRNQEFASVQNAVKNMTQENQTTLIQEFTTQNVPINKMLKKVAELKQQRAIEAYKNRRRQLYDYMKTQLNMNVKDKKNIMNEFNNTGTLANMLNKARILKNTRVAEKIAEDRLKIEKIIEPLELNEADRNLILKNFNTKPGTVLSSETKAKALKRRRNVEKRANERVQLSNHLKSLRLSETNTTKILNVFDRTPEKMLTMSKLNATGLRKQRNRESLTETMKTLILTDAVKTELLKRFRDKPGDLNILIKKARQVDQKARKQLDLQKQTRNYVVSLKLGNKDTPILKKITNTLTPQTAKTIRTEAEKVKRELDAEIVEKKRTELKTFMNKTKITAGMKRSFIVKVKLNTDLDALKRKIQAAEGIITNVKNRGIRLKGELRTYLNTLNLTNEERQRIEGSVGEKTKNLTALKRRARTLSERKQIMRIQRGMQRTMGRKATIKRESNNRQRAIDRTKAAKAFRIKKEELEKIVNKLPLNSKDKKTYLNKLKLPKAPLNGITRNLKKFVKNANISNKKKETYITELK